MADIVLVIIIVIYPTYRNLNQLVGLVEVQTVKSGDKLEFIAL